MEALPRTSTRIFALALMLSLSYTACSGGGGGPSTDASGEVAPDVLRDTASEKGRDLVDAATADASTDAARSDASVDLGDDSGSDLSDASVDRGAPTDAARDLDSGPTESCTMAPLYQLFDDALRVEGDTTSFVDDALGVACRATSGGDLPGPQAYLAFAVEKDQWYKAVLAPSFDAYFYLFTSASCDSAVIEADCQSEGATGVASRSVSGDRRQALYLRAPDAGKITVAVDSIASWFNGAFSLEVEAITPASNTRCANAVPLSFVSGVAVARGDTAPNLGATDPVGIVCEGDDLAGPHAFYTFSAQAGATYDVSLAADAAQFIHLYLAETDCDAAAISAACSSAGATGGYLTDTLVSGEQGALTFTANLDGDVIVGVASGQTFNYGSFTLRVEER